MVVSGGYDSATGKSYCLKCGQEIKNLSRVYVRVNFPRDIGDFPECYVADFCSLECMRSFDWEKLKDRDAWWKMHRGEGIP